MLTIGSIDEQFYLIFEHLLWNTTVKAFSERFQPLFDSTVCHINIFAVRICQNVLLQKWQHKIVKTSVHQHDGKQHEVVRISLFRYNNYFRIWDFYDTDTCF